MNIRMPNQQFTEMFPCMARSAVSYATAYVTAQLPTEREEIYSQQKDVNDPKLKIIAVIHHQLTNTRRQNIF